MTYIMWIAIIALAMMIPLGRALSNLQKMRCMEGIRWDDRRGIMHCMFLWHTDHKQGVLAGQCKWCGRTATKSRGSSVHVDLPVD
ncbi:MAG: hypothetical protein A3B23_02230 [Candidatus Colwellbacteria bacterium RIFCSPLOWO2_01_FULL_48_10]|uniref:Uncharacterized protein n=2 Tax=Bacteria candidate phyla TaxID=1783234 RepID=A0A1F5P3X3_9BACT|nr:MAG: hypothetical protein A2846_03665 [Candidatus Doudnabacteria bacterium RIFCSPHIGHO2_01_FULL_49_9]OGY59944.1 MAG: hypothetical protein A3B23_02230 [Candidatus Colwellbacteria bacterium RIFCSPLOWO2_01_FULL_48_10]